MERVTIVDRENREVGVAERREMRDARLPHRACYILVFNSKGRLFLHRRSSDKDVYPGLHDPAVGGVVLAGESYDESARRELREEVGIETPTLTPHLDFYFEDAAGRVWGRVYTALWDGEVTLQTEEIQDGRFRPLEEIFRLAVREPFAPDSLEALHRYRGARRRKGAAS